MTKKILLILTLNSTLFFGCVNSTEISVNELNKKYNIYIQLLSNNEINQKLSQNLIPIAIKDNIDVLGFPNTAGSIALKNNFPNKNAFLIQKLIDNGYFIQGKTNLSEWANFRSTKSTSGWSSMVGQTINPYGNNRNPCGSSSGSGVAVAVGAVEVAIGTETNGSISCPASVNGIVGIKPTVGLVSRSGIIPISNTQDTAGPMALSVRKAAEVLEVISGTDPNDPATLKIPSDFDFSFTKDLNQNSLNGKRLGLLKAGSDDDAGKKLINRMKSVLKKAGATVVEFDDVRNYPSNEEFLVLMYEFKIGLEDYLLTSNSNLKTFRELIDFNNKNKEEVLKYFDQSIFLKSDSILSKKKDYLEALKVVMSSREQIDAILKNNKLDALVGLSRNPAWEINHEGGDSEAMSNQRSWSNGSFAAMAGYPNIIIPLGMVDGLPAGMSFIGSAWDDKKLIEYAYAFEQVNGFVPRPSY
tara:strand:+ start:509 stop:1918 length:1410 start_codon:yes stop_codon:yes gene_type:complete